MSISKNTKIFIAISIALILIVAVFIAIRNRTATTASPQASNALPESVGQPIPATPVLPEGSPQTPPVQKPPADSSFQIEKQTSYSYDILKDDTGIETSVQSVAGDFKLDDIGVSTPAATTRLANGEDILILSGCTPHFCGGTGLVIAYNKSDKKSYLLKERVGSAAGYEIFGNPPEEIRNLLVYYFFYQ